jgi:hypothetical protein
MPAPVPAFSLASNYDLFVVSVAATAPDIAIFECRMGGALLRALRAYGASGLPKNLVEGTLPTSALLPFTLTGSRVFQAPKHHFSLRLVSPSDPVSGVDPLTDDADGRLLIVQVLLPKTGSMATLKLWCESLGGTYGQEYL